MSVVINKTPAVARGADLKDYALPDREVIRDTLASRIVVEASTYDTKDANLRDDAYAITTTETGYDLDVCIADVDDAISKGFHAKEANLLRGKVKPTITFRFKLSPEFEVERIEYHLSETRVLRNFSFEQADELIHSSGPHTRQVKLLREAARALSEYYGSHDEIESLTGISREGARRAEPINNMDDVTRVLMESVSRAAADLVRKFPCTAIYRTSVPRYVPTTKDLKRLISGEAKFDRDVDLSHPQGLKNYFSTAPIDGYGGHAYLRVTSPMIQSMDLINLSILKAVISGDKIPNYGEDAHKIASMQNDPSSTRDEKYHLNRVINEHLITQAMFRRVLSGGSLTLNQTHDLFIKRIPALPQKGLYLDHTLKALTLKPETVTDLLHGLMSKGVIVGHHTEKDRAAGTTTFTMDMAKNEQIRTEVMWKDGAGMHLSERVAKAGAILKYIAPKLSSGDIADMGASILAYEDVTFRYAVRHTRAVEKTETTEPSLSDDVSRLAEMFEDEGAEAEVFDGGIKELLSSPDKAFWLITRWIEDGKIERGSNKIQRKEMDSMISLKTKDGESYNSFALRMKDRPTKELAHRARAEALVSLITGFSDRDDLRAYLQSIESN